MQTRQFTGRTAEWYVQPSIAACKLTAYQDGEVYLPTQ